MKNRLAIICILYIALTGHVYSQIALTLNPEENDFNTEILSELHSEINGNDYGEVHSLLIVRNGDLVFEEYYNDYSRDQLHPLYSISKTFTSALIGIAIDQGKIESVNEYMLDFFPEYSTADIQNNNSFKKAIQLKHLLTMTAGFNYDVGDNWWGNNVMHYWLNAPVSYDPGEVWNYSSESTLILSGIIQNKTGESAEDFANRNLFTPLGITHWYWSKIDDQDEQFNDLTNTAAGLWLRPLDLAHFGQLYLQKGEWNGHQIISREWVEESINVHVDFAKDDRSYGYQLYQFLPSSSVSKMLHENDVFFGVGAQQQRIYVIPHLECVVVINGNFASSNTIFRRVLSAVNGATILTASPDDHIESNGFNSFENYPNPFNQSTVIKYNLSKANHVILKIYNSNGQEIETLVNDFQMPGKHEVHWRSKGLPSGIYHCKLQADEFFEVKKLVLR